MTKIRAKHVGHTVDFMGCNGYGCINGRIVAVKNRIVTIEYWLRGSLETFTTFMPVDDSRILTVYA